MKFKFKLLIVNIIVLSVSLGITGYLMIRINFNLARETLIESAITENNLAQTYVDYDILDYINSDGNDLESELAAIGARVNNMLPPDTSFKILYDGKIIFINDASPSNVPLSLLSQKGISTMNYIISEKLGVHNIFVLSCNEVNHKYLQIVTGRSAEDAYGLMKTQLNYFRVLLLSILILGSFFIYILATILTKPLEKLNNVSSEMARGHYDVRASVNSTDEVGQLSDNFNEMASAVERHVHELEDQIHRREQFVADFTHEIKTPMTSIIGYADTMRSVDLPKEDQLMALNYIVSAGERLENMSGQLFNLIYLNRTEIETQEISTIRLAEDIKAYVSPMLSKKDISLNVDVEQGNIVGNSYLLISAFSNFIDNSRKASYEHSEISLVGRNITESKYEFRVIDHGIGMNLEHLDKICNEFYMVDKSRSRMEGSAGLGLSLASLIIKRHNAALTIDSEEQVGTTVIVVFLSGPASKQHFESSDNDRSCRDNKEVPHEKA